MNQITKYIERIQFIDKLIRTKRANTPSQLAAKTNLSERQIITFIKTMKELGAPIKYCRVQKIYFYEENVIFICKFEFFSD